MSVSSVCRSLMCCTSNRWKPKFKMELKLTRLNKPDQSMNVDVHLNVGEPIQEILHRILFHYHLFSKFDAGSATFSHQPELNYPIDQNSCVDVNFKKVTVAVNELEKTLKCIISCKIQLPDGEVVYSNALLPHRSSIDMAINDVIAKNGVPLDLYNRYSAYRLRQDGSLTELDENCTVHHNGHYVIFMHNCPTALVTLRFNDQELNQKVFLEKYRTINDALKLLVNRLEIYSYTVTNVECNHKHGREGALHSLEHTMVDQGRYKVTIKECIIKIQVEVGAAGSFVPTNLFVPAGISVDRMRHSLNSQATLEEDIMVYDKEYDTWILTMKGEKVKAENRYRLIVNEDFISPISSVVAKTSESSVELQKTQNSEDVEGILTETSDLNAQTTSKLRSDTNCEQFVAFKDGIGDLQSSEGYNECNEQEERKFEGFEAGDGADRTAKEKAEDEQSPYSSDQDSLYYSVDRK